MGSSFYSKVNVRLFFSIPVSAEIKTWFSEVQTELVDYRNVIRFVDPAIVHLTLRFLGDQEESQLATIINKSSGVMNASPAFALELQSVTFSPSPNNAHSLLVQINEGKEEFLELQRRLDLALKETGFVFDSHKVEPHLTVGRIRDPKKTLAKDLVEKVSALSLPKEGNFLVDKIILMESWLSPKGPTYLPLKDFNLRGSRYLLDMAYPIVLF